MSCWSFLWGQKMHPRSENGIGATLTLILWPTVVANMPEGLPITPGIFIFMMLKETFVGIVIGFVAAEIFYTVEMSGQLIDLYRGANQAQLFVPQITERSSAFGSLGYQLILALLSLSTYTTFSSRHSSKVLLRSPSTASQTFQEVFIHSSKRSCALVVILSW